MGTKFTTYKFYAGYCLHKVFFHFYLYYDFLTLLAPTQFPPTPSLPFFLFLREQPHFRKKSLISNTGNPLIRSLSQEVIVLIQTFQMYLLHLFVFPSDQPPAWCIL